MLTTKQAARRIGISLPYIYDLIRQNKIKYKRIGATYIFEQQDVHTFKKQWGQGMTGNQRISRYSPTECRNILKSEGFYNNREKGKKRGWWLENEYYGISAQDAFRQWAIAKAPDKNELRYLEKRKYYRKKTCFNGELIEGDEAFKNITVVDLSRSGARITASGKKFSSLSAGKIGTLIFHLDDQAASLVSKEAMIRTINETESICEFIKFNPYDRLTRYLAGTDFSTGRRINTSISEEQTESHEENNFINDMFSLFEDFLAEEPKP